MRLDNSMPNSKLYDFIIKIASGQSSLEECRMWFFENVISNR